MSSSNTLKVIVFPGGFNLPIWIAQEHGFFKRENLTVELTPTPGSVYQMTHLISGDFDIAHTAMDNVVAYREGQGEVPIEGQPDLVAFMGIDSGFLCLITKSRVQSYADLRGGQLSVDALTTGYAFVLRKMLEVNHLQPRDYELLPAGGAIERWQALVRGEHAGTLLITPFEILAQQHGFNLLDNAVDVIGRYQGVVAATRRAWAATHKQELTSYIRAYVAALNWLYDTTNNDAALELLTQNTTLAPGIALEAYHILVDSEHGFSPTASFDIEGIQTVISLRNQYAIPSVVLKDPAQYITLEYYKRAIGTSATP